jgi:4'-phosphopantetheinyl transferase
MKVYWLEQTEADLPNGGTGVPPVDGHAQDGPATRPESEWLGAKERVQLSAMRFAKRRADWQLGRWTAKHALAACLCLPDDHLVLAKIELRSASSGAPEVFFANKPAPATISLSHREGIAVCAVALQSGALGCDLEMIEARSDAFLADYFTIEEQELVAQTPEDDRSRLLALLWSAKESALKALHAGLRLDTRSVSVLPPILGRRRFGSGEGCIEQAAFGEQPAESLEPWLRLHVRCHHGQCFHGWWKQTGRFVRTVLATELALPPTLLTPSGRPATPVPS